MTPPFNNKIDRIVNKHFDTFNVSSWDTHSYDKGFCKNNGNGIREQYDEIIIYACEVVSKHNSINLPYLVSHYIIPYMQSRNLMSSDFFYTYRDKEYKRIYMKLYRFFKKRTDICIIEKKDKLIWITPKPQIIDLITAGAKFKLCKNHSKPKSIYAFPQKVNEFRLDALKRVVKVKVLYPELWDSVKGLFDLYLDEIDSQAIVLKKTDEAPPEYDEFLVLPYSTRFNDDIRKKMIIKKYHEAWKKANELWDSAIFITLTTDPKMFKSIWHSWRHMSYALNRFLSFIGKRLHSSKYRESLKSKRALKSYAKFLKSGKKRPDYICVFEFSKKNKTGLLHIHIVIFGILYLMDKRELTRLWMKYGQGKINYIYALRRRKGKWIWLHNKKPDFVFDESIDSYLKKYLIKGLYDRDSTAFLYWVSGKRFFTCSRDLLKHFISIRISLGYYQFVMSCDIISIPDYIWYNRHSINGKPPPNPYSYALFHPL